MLEPYRELPDYTFLHPGNVLINFDGSVRPGFKAERNVLYRIGTPLEDSSSLFGDYAGGKRFVSITIHDSDLEVKGGIPIITMSEESSFDLLSVQQASISDASLERLRDGLDMLELDRSEQDVSIGEFIQKLPYVSSDGETTEIIDHNNESLLTIDRWNTSLGPGASWRINRDGNTIIFSTSRPVQTILKEMDFEEILEMHLELSVELEEGTNVFETIADSIDSTASRLLSGDFEYADLKSPLQFRCYLNRRLQPNET